MDRLDKLNEFVNNAFGDLFQTSSPRYRYWENKKRDKFFWTTQPVLKEVSGATKPKKRWSSGIYRYIKSKKQWKLYYRVDHAKMKDAKTRARKLYGKDKLNGKYTR